MNMPVPVGSIADRWIIEQLLRANALTPATAQSLTGLWGVRQRRLQRLLSTGVVREGAPGSYYLDAPALAAYWYGMRRRLLLAAAGLLLLGIIAFLARAWRLLG